MTAFLADTHILLWHLQHQDRLSARQRAIFEQGDATVFVSIASFWEASIKAGLGKLTVPDSFAETVLASGFDLLSVTTEHTDAIRHVPPHHGDPFDRMPIAQAMLERLTLLSADSRFGLYDVAVV